MAPKLRTDPPPAPTEAAEDDDAPAVSLREIALTRRQRDLVAGGLPMVERIVARIGRRCGDLVSEEDAYVVGAIALSKAAQRYRDDLHPSFLHYAACSVKGALLDLVEAENYSLRAEVERAMQRVSYRFSGEQVLDYDLFTDSDEELTAVLRRGARDKVAVTYLASMLDGRQATPEEELSELEGRRAKAALLDAALASLEPGEREVFDLLYRQELDRAEVAARLHIHRNTVHNREMSALRKLAAFILEHPLPDD